MQLATVWQHVQEIQQEIRHGTRETQDTVIVALQDCLDESGSALFPSFVYPQLTELLHFYCHKVLPKMGLSREDLWFVRESFEQTQCHIQVQEQTAKTLETQFKQFFLDVKSGKFETVEDISSGIASILLTLTPRLSSEASHRVCPSSDASKTPGDSLRLTTVVFKSPGSAIPPLRGAGGCIPLLGGVRSGLQKQFRTLKKFPFTATHIIPFFKTLIDKALPEEAKIQFARIHDLFWHQLNDLLQMKAVVVNTKSNEALITRLDIETSFRSQGLDTLEFKSNVDDSMSQSCWNAVQTARNFLEEHFPDSLKNQSLSVTCRFPNQGMEYNDTSASLLVGLKVVGDALDMEIDPHTLVTGALDEFGTVQPVQCIAEKIEAARTCPDIHRLFLPSEGFVIENPTVSIVKVHTLSGAVERCYGETFHKKVKQRTRKMFVPLVFSVFKHLFITAPNPVLASDFRLIDCAKDLYQKKGEYQSAIVIFDSLVTRFQQEDAVTDALRLKAEALGYLGVIYTEQHQFGKSVEVLHHALELWQAMHDWEQCVNTLLRIGSVHRYAFMDDGNPLRWKESLRCCQRARKLTHPSMQQYGRLQAKYDRLAGYLYYLSEDYARAEQHCRRSMEWSDGDDTTYHQWNYHTAKQHLGRILMKRSEYDRACDMLESTANAAVLQTPHNQARSFWILSEFFFARNEIETGIAWAEKAETLCLHFGLTAEQQMLTLLLARYNVGTHTK